VASAEVIDAWKRAPPLRRRTKPSDSPWPAARQRAAQLRLPLDLVARVVAQIGHVRDHPDDRPVRPEEALLQLHGVQLSAQDPPRELDVARAIVGMGELVVALAHERRAAAAEHCAQRVVDANVAAVGAEDRHADRRMVERGIEVGAEILDELVAVHLAQQAQRRAVHLL